MRHFFTFGVVVVVVVSLIVGCGDQDPAPKTITQCTEVDPHPVAEGIAREFDVTYDEVMAWFCGGYAFDDILLALQTAELVDQPAAELLVMNEEYSWDEVWETLGLVSPPNQRSLGASN
jgi:hypothetical protein